MPPDPRTCPVMVSEPPGYWHQHRCDRPTKFRLTVTDSFADRYGPTVDVCGTHRRSYPFKNYPEAEHP